VSVGDRVAAFAVGMEKVVNTSLQSAFQEYVVVRLSRISPILPIPNGISFE
jgi:NADPH:quinone reductase-like Zn-dependent oxidoreductase